MEQVFLLSQQTEFVICATSVNLEPKFYRCPKELIRYLNDSLPKNTDISFIFSRRRKREFAYKQMSV